MTCLIGQRCIRGLGSVGHSINLWLAGVVGWRRKQPCLTGSSTSLAERSERLQTLDTNFQGFAIGVKEALGDAAIPKMRNAPPMQVSAVVHGPCGDQPSLMPKDYGIRHRRAPCRAADHRCGAGVSSKRQTNQSTSLPVRSNGALPTGAESSSRRSCLTRKSSTRSCRF